MKVTFETISNKFQKNLDGEDDAENQIKAIVSCIFQESFSCQQYDVT